MFSKLKNMNKTAIAVLTFIIFAVILFGYSEQSKAEQSVQIGLGETVINSHLTVGEIGYEYNQWEIQAALIEAGATKNGRQDQMEVYSVSYRTEPNLEFFGIQPYSRLGVSYNSGSELVGDTNFRLGLGLDFHNVWRVEFSHHSSSSIHDPNTGVDAVTITRTINPPWN